MMPKCHLVLMTNFEYDDVMIIKDFSGDVRLDHQGQYWIAVQSHLMNPNLHHSHLFCVSRAIIPLQSF